MIRRTTWITLAVFVVLLGFAIWWTSFRQQTTDTTTPVVTPSPIWSLTASDVDVLRVEDPTSGEAVELHRDDDEQWVLAEPVEAAADVMRVESAVSWLAAPVAERTLDPVNDFAPYGLAEPSKIVRVDLKDGSSLSLEIGREAPTSSVVYVRVSGRPEIHTLSIYALNTVLDLLSDIPMAAPIPTLTSSPTEIQPEIEATETPTMEATATP
ncbi:MAG: DUF4340 domain-containing protein [Anaerolineales bacterium]|jgi:hypothetical protein